MSLKRLMILWACVYCGLIIAPSVWAAGTSGTIESVSADREKITVKPTGDKPKRVFSVPNGVKITLDGKPVKLSDLKEGQQISVFTNSSDTVTQVIVRNEKDKSDASATTPIAKGAPKSKKTETTANSSRDDNSGGKPGDSPQFRGPRRDGHAGNANHISNNWSPSGPKPAWSVNGLAQAMPPSQSRTDASTRWG